MKKVRLIWIVTLLTLGLTACGGGSSNKAVTHKSGRFISSTLLQEYSNKQIDIAGVDTKYPVKVYKIVYETKNIDGQFIDASGLLSVPQKGATAKSPTLLYHHGTTYENKYAPTEFVRPDSFAVLPAYLGYIALAPDYIGYGESSDVLHPYLNVKVTATTSVDLLRASQSFLKENDIRFNQQLFLGGYSQGGGATLGTQKLIETDLSDEFTVTASSAGAGGYALSKELLQEADNILSHFDVATFKRPSNLGLIFKAMDTAYALDSLDKIFQPKYASVVDDIYDGSHSSVYIDAKLSHQASKLMKKDFLQRLLNGEEEAVVNAFKANDLYDWSPKAPTRLYHGRDDDWVYFRQAQLAYDTMRARGADNVELVECKVDAGKLTNHSNCFFPYLFSSYEYFLPFAEDL